MTGSEAGRERVTPRAVLLGLALLPCNAWWLIQIEFVRYSDTPTIPQMFFHCVATLVALVLLNGLVRRLQPRSALSPGELLTIYAMQVVGSNVAGHDQLQILFATIVYVKGRATPENHWAEVTWPHLKGRLVVGDEHALELLFRGHSSVGEAGWAGWVAPLAIWSVVALTVAGTLLCVATLLRRQWDHERLTYPLAEIPLWVADPSHGLFRAPVFWLGAGLAAGMQLLNLVHQLAPAVPGIGLGVTNFRFPSLPLSAMGPIPICWYPFAFGLSFLLPTNLAFSCWFFFLLTRLERLVAALFGFTVWDGFPYVTQQASGAWLGFGLFVIWAARGHLRYTWRVATGREPDPSPREPMSYRTAWLGFLAGGAALFFFSVAAGMRWPVAVAFWVALLLIILTVARIRAEVGLPSIELFRGGADDILRRAYGTLGLRPGDLVVMTLFYWLNRTQRNYNLQHELHGLRLGARSGVDLRGLTKALLLAAAVGIPLAFWAMITVSYDVGFEGAKFTGPAPRSFGLDAWNRLATYLQQPTAADRGATAAFVVGAAICWLLVWARVKLVWWPFHPAGFVVADSFALMRLWVPLTITWAVKSLLLRYGGLKAYRRALPFFLGLAIGEFCAALFRTLVDLTWSLYLPPGSGIGGL